jgi:hypothetical protein
VQYPKHFGYTDVRANKANKRMSTALQEAYELLKHSRSNKRESGAKRLRKLGLAQAGSALLEALQKEIQDSRTWSTQYHLIVALGVCQNEEALPYLWSLTQVNFKATILYYALGDAIFRLSVLRQTIAETLDQLYQTHNYKLIYGAFRALALLRLVPDEATIKKAIAMASNPAAEEVIQGYPGDPTGLRVWIAVAAAGWKQN